VKDIPAFPEPFPEMITDEELKGIVAMKYAAFAVSSNARAIPFVGDGFKPVHRRILYGISQVASRSLVKSARIVGDILGK
jgi:DNA gyrase/topoisomerase IV subunit A